MQEIILEKPDTTLINSYKKISLIIKEQNVSIENITKVTSISMEVIEDIKELNGTQKKELVSKCINRLIEKSHLTQDKKEHLYTLLNDFVPDVIAVIVSASKGELNVNKAISVATRLVKWIGKCCRRCRK